MDESAFGRFGYEGVNVPEIEQVWQAPTLGAERAGVPAGSGLDEQFMLFQLGDGEKPLRDLTDVTPAIAGGDAEPDVQASIALMSFHLSAALAGNVEENTRATLRLDLGKDDASNSQLEALFWSIASGLDLYEHVKSGGNSSNPKRMNDDFAAKFRQRPVEIPGGLGRLRIEIVSHPEPPWWRRAIRFLTEDQSVKRIISSIGFPGIALDAVRLLDEMLGRFEEANATPLIQSRPLTLAFSQAARDDFTAGTAIAKVGSIAPGFYVLARHADTGVFQQDPPVYLGTTGHLAPKAKWETDPVGYDHTSNPYELVTYAVLRFRTRGTRLAGL